MAQVRSKTDLLPAFQSILTVSPSALRALQGAPQRVRRNFARFFYVIAASLLACVALNGCGAGGYAGEGIASISATNLTIDAGQSVIVNASVGNMPTLWTLAGDACSGAGCGLLSSTTGSSTTYTAPSGIAAQMSVTVQVGIAGTTNSRIVHITVNPDPVISTPPPAGNVGVAYAATLSTQGGTAPIKLGLLSGSLPPGLSFNAATGAVSGTPTASGNFSVVLQATDSSDVPDTVKATEPFVISVASSGGGSGGSGGSGTGTGGTGTGGTGTGGGTGGTGSSASTLAVASTALPAATVGAPYGTSLQASGGTAPYTWQIVAGALPAGVTLAADSGILSGTPTAQGTYPFTAQVQDATGSLATGVFGITVSAPTPSASLSFTTGSLPAGTVGLAYSSTIGLSGGTAPYTCTITSGTLPAGLTLGTGCTVSGTPTAATTASLGVTATDAANPAKTVNGTVTLAINPATGLTLTSPPAATAGSPYSGTVGVTGGTAPYTCSLAGGTLPAGLTLASNCTLTGTPTTTGTTSANVTVTDSGSPAQTSTGAVTLVVNPAALTLSTGTLPNGTVGAPYSSTLGVSGGVAPYTCTITSGALPSGLALGTNCSVTGTPTTAGTSAISVKATDSASPADVTTGQVSLTVNPAALSLTLGSLPNGTVGATYGATIGVAGGSAPYACAITSGTLPAGLTLGTDCLVTGTPTTAGTSTISVKSTDAASPSNAINGQVSVTISPAALSLTTGTLPNGTVGIPYSAAVGVTGGVAPYTCALVSGTLPAGLRLGSDCLVTGTPTVAGTTSITVRASDSATPANTSTGQIGITVNPAIVLALSTPPAATVGTPYSGAIGVTGGTGPYSCTIRSGTLPTGLSLGTHCAVTGTPTTAGTATVTVQATDSSNPANTTSGTVSLTVNPAPATLSAGSPAAATVSTPYTGTIPVTGGTAPYACTLGSGTLPAGLSLGPNCTVTGTPTTAGTATIEVTATDNSNPVLSTTAPVTLTVNPLTSLTFTGALPNAVVGVAYTQTLSASGGLAPYTYAVTAGSLPAGLTLSSAGVVSGTPTAPGASSFTVTATDSEATPQTASLPLVLLVTYPPTASDAELQGPYAFLFQGYDDVVNGVLAYQTATVGSFTADGAGLINAGELDANHQSSAPVATTVSSHPFIGTYTLGTDGRGSLTVSTLNHDGTVGETNTYSLSLKAPVAPATAAASGSMIESDDDQGTGTRGSGTLLAQTTTAFANGLTGSYVFGAQGDTPCLASCALNLNLYGPVAEVGQFTTSSGAVTGTADANIAATNYPNDALSGSYSAADGNGKLELSLTTANVPAGVYPTDFAVYLVNANQAFVMSTDKHSAYILLAGQVQLQTQAAFSNASANGPYVGYENSPANPGLLGQTLQTVLNLSTATIFQGDGNGTGTCTTNSVTQGGVTGLLNTLSGLGSVVSTLQGVLGSYALTGTSACPVAVNGREVLNYVAPYTDVLGVAVVTGSAPAARIAYLYGPNQGFFLETGYAGLGKLEQQSGAPFSMGTLDGTFIYASTPAASLASTNASGVFTANGQGTATTTLDENVGVGNINVLQLGSAGSFPYSLTNATFGTYQLGATDVIYAISPERFVLVDTNATTTSPSVSLLY